MLGSGFIPSEYISEGSPSSTSTVTASELAASFNTTAEDTDSLGEQVGFFKKILTFLFVTWTIEGIPVAIGLLLLALNLFSIIIAIVWVYDKVRGIGS